MHIFFVYFTITMTYLSKKFFIQDFFLKKSKEGVGWVLKPNVNIIFQIKTSIYLRKVSFFVWSNFSIALSLLI